MQRAEGKNSGKITILGGGMAGLAVAYHAGQAKLDFTLFEKDAVVGGNCRTLKKDGFAFDSGAHRFHDKDAAMTAKVKALLGSSLHEIRLPSKIHDHGKLITFPLQPLELLRHMGWKDFMCAGLDLLQRKLGPKQRITHFEAYAINTYGKRIAERFLLNYSEKLWGVPCSGLSPAIAGKRLKGLDIHGFIKQMFRPARSEAHMEGTFYYPEGGIAALGNVLVRHSGRDKVKCNTEVTGLIHSGGKITAVEVRGARRMSVDDVVCTLPLNRIIQMLKPAPAREIIDAAGKLRFRQLRLVALFVRRPSILKAATLYFPDAKVPFTRLYEPKNRNAGMAPQDRTSLVAEIPCFEEDTAWTCPEVDLIAKVKEQVVGSGLVTPEEIMDAMVVKLRDAYPVLSVEAEKEAGVVLDYLRNYTNLYLTGRNAKYEYTWIHNLLREGETLAEALRVKQEQSSARQRD